MLSLNRQLLSLFSNFTIPRSEIVDTSYRILQAVHYIIKSWCIISVNLN